MKVAVQLLVFLVALAVLLPPTSEARRRGSGGAHRRNSSGLRRKSSHKPITQSDIESRFGDFELPSVVDTELESRNGFGYELFQSPYFGPFECNPYIDVALQICFKQFIGTQQYVYLREFMNSQVVIQIMTQYHINIQSYQHLGSFFIAIFQHALECPQVISHQTWVLAIKYFYPKCSVTVGPPPIEIGSSHGITVDIVGIFQAIMLESVNQDAEAQRCLDIIFQFIQSSTHQLVEVFNSLKIYQYQTRGAFLIAFLKQCQALQTATPTIQQSISVILNYVSTSGVGTYPVDYKLCQTTCLGGGSLGIPNFDIYDQHVPAFDNTFQITYGGFGPDFRSYDSTEKKGVYIPVD